MAVGILGGAFDPPHNGHVALAHEAVRRFELERLLVTVVADPGHKRVGTPLRTRLELARLAFADVPRAVVEPEPHSRTVDALEARGLDDPIFLIGADELIAFSTWKEPERVLSLARLGVATRPGYLPRVDVSRPDRVLLFELEPLPISSTEIRSRAARGESLDGLVPAAVAAVIARRGLYRPAPGYTEPIAGEEPRPS